MRSSVRWGWLLVVLAAFALWPALTRDIASSAYDAAMEHVPRAVVFSQAISDGTLYPRWTQFLHWGLGSPLFTFQPPLPYYALDLLFRLGIPHPIGWRILMAGGLLATFFGAYLLVLTVTGKRWPAALAAVAFLYAPYVIRNALHRGSNEAYGMFLYPWVLWGLIWVARRPSVGRFVVATLLWAACIAAHVLAPLMLLPFALSLAILLAWRNRSARTPGAAFSPVAVLLAGALLTAGIWAPMIPEQSYVHIERDFSPPEAVPLHNPVPLDRLLAAPAIYDMARGNNGTGDSVGVLHFGVLLLGLPAALYAWVRKRRALACALGASTAAGLLLLWMLTSASDPLWGLQVIGALLARVLYRTRLMGLETLAAACVAGLMLALFSERWQRNIGAVAIALMILTALPSLYLELLRGSALFGARASLADVRATEIDMGGTALTAYGEFTPRWRDAPFDDALLKQIGAAHDPETQPLVGPSPGVEVKQARVRSDSWQLALDAVAPSTLTLYLLYYPRWQGTIDGQPIALRPQAATGYVQFDMPAGSHDLALRYGSTAVERAGLLTSAATLLALLVVLAGAIARGGWQRAMWQVPAEAPPRSESTRRDSAPSAWLLAGATAFLLLKIGVIDPHTTWLRCVSSGTYVCGAQASTTIPFAGGPDLRGYAVSSDVLRRGEVLRVKLYWEGKPARLENLYSFVHIRNSQKGWPVNPRTGSEIWAQEDHFSLGGMPARDLLPGKLYEDELRVSVPEDMPPGEYFLEVGLLNPETGEQLDPQAEAVKLPLRILWRSVLLPSVRVQ